MYSYNWIRERTSVSLVCLIKLINFDAFKSTQCLTNAYICIIYAKTKRLNDIIRIRVNLFVIMIPPNELLSMAVYIICLTQKTNTAGLRHVQSTLSTLLGNPGEPNPRTRHAYMGCPRKFHLNYNWDFHCAA